jgi:hypothetical protein
MLLIIVATGNHFFLDAAAGALVVAAGWLVAALLRAPAAEAGLTEPVRLPAPANTWTPHRRPVRARAA